MMEKLLALAGGGSGGGGGGDTPTYGLLETIAITEAVSEIAIDLSNLVKADGRLFLSFESVTFSASNYMYLKIGNFSSARGIYRGNAAGANFDTQILFAPQLVIDGKTFGGFLSSYPGWSNSSGGAAPIITTVPDTLYLLLNNSSNTFTGGTIKVYGRTA